MKLYLLKDSPVKFTSPWKCDGDEEEPNLYSKAIILNTHLQPRYPGNVAEESICEQVMATNSSTEINWAVKLTVTAEPHESRMLGNFSVRLGKASEVPSKSTKSPRVQERRTRNTSDSNTDEAPKVKMSILEKLQKVYPAARIKVSIKDFHPPDRAYNGGVDITTKPMKISSSNVNCHSSVNEVYPPEKFSWNPITLCYTCKVTISVKLPLPEQNSSPSLPAPASASTSSTSLAVEPMWSSNNFQVVQVSQEFPLNKRILDEGLGSDVLITARNGAKIACHKSFLCAQSPVLKSYLASTGTGGGDIQSLVMREMSEGSVRAFLAHLYYWDIADALRDVNIAIELFTAAREYQVTSLEKSMTDLLLGKPMEQFDIAQLLQLFRAVRELESAQNLKLKITQSLMLRPEELRKSNDFKNLFKHYPEDAMDLCLSILCST